VTQVPNWKISQTICERYGQKSVERLSQWYPNAIQVHTPVHASWLNQIEIYFSVVQRTVPTLNAFPDLATLEGRLLEFQTY